ncbi:wax ester/triacylglycerol synthase family O-acyltransferase [Thermomonospora sp. CIF 1]|uniref:WS/DGAT/MGAT family O-acyltransferase n=1 Tax=Thermomonospora sp. CIF 1 TaxID=1916083 RepID=UPI000B229C81|nr:wax ester/triacylglycerol synthase family O-acyltransferase [Thermomonospora sp. CIF 1]PKK12400.1 MAG: wax ester/triacylglycerol synthase family O-acyltransferase [Thermomonospora sp. CIF 1]
MRQLTAVDANFLNVETGTTHAHIAGLGILDPVACPGGRLTAEDLIEVIRERAHLAPRPLRMRLAAVPLGIDRPYWEDDPDFDPARHVFEVGLPAPGNAAQLAEVVAMLHERPLDRARPLWEAVVIQGLEGGRTAVYIKVHHAAVDGVLATETLAALLDLSPQPRELPPDDTVPQQAPALAERVRTGLLRALAHPVRGARMLARTAPYLDEIPGLAQLPGVQPLARAIQGALGRDGVVPLPRTVAPPTPFNGTISARRAVAFGELPLAEIRRIRRELGGSVNDVVMALVATALHRWLDKRGELPDRPLVAAVPVSLRRGRDGDAAGGNRMSAMVTPLATHLADPAERFAAIRGDLAAAKRRFARSSGAWLEGLSELVPAPLAGPLLRLALQARPGEYLRPVNLLVSNVPGPDFPLYLRGARVLGYFPISVVSDLTGGLNITVLSYDGKLDVGIVTCRQMIPDPWEIMDHLDDALGELRGLIDG